ncbi:MAG: hypothetical protein H7X95_01325 [Deltaproteobacteria bacterium]|nr:hypothetical protein [Deltaproteobacteria bacterium]
MTLHRDRQLLNSAVLTSCWGALVCVAIVAAGGCYRPMIEPGGLRCAPTPAMECPDGFTCVSGFCHLPGAGGTGGRAGTGGVGGRGGRGGTGGGGGASGGAGGTCANAITPLCQSPAGLPPGCDPVCQTGCPCGLRCNVTGTTTGCMPALGTKTLGEICSITADDCVPGLACLKERCGTNVGRCYRFCRDGSVCGTGIACGMIVDFPNGGRSGSRACNVGDQVPACDVYTRMGCPDSALVCYVANQGTKCDCPSVTNRGEGENCTFYDECASGLTCLNLGNVSQCHKLCKTNADCTGGASCTPSGSFSFCP